MFIRIVVITIRVVSGIKKGLKLRPVPGISTRPTTDKVKESIFNMIGPYFTGGFGLDLFAGSGALGIEALSRGLDKVIFIDKDFKAIQTIKANIAFCDFSTKAEVYRNDAERALKAVQKRKIQFELIFLDPPYAKQKLHKLIEQINEYKLLADNGFIIAEHDSEVKLPEQIGLYSQVKAEKYGITALTIFQNSTVKE